jgi:starch synthase
MSLRILVCASEVVPFVKTGGLADVAGALPKALAKLGHEVRVALPKYQAVASAKVESEKLGKRLSVAMGWDRVEVGVEVSEAIAGTKTYLLDCPRYFSRDRLYGEPDDAERFACFCRGVVELLRQEEWRPQVIHANDWQTGLVPLYLRRAGRDDSALAPIATLFTIHNLAYQGVFGPEVLPRIGIDPSLFTMEGVEFYGQVNLMKAGLVFADLLSTVSETYSREIQTREYGERLEGVLAKRREDLFGVLNGIDYEEWNPATDTLIAASYSADDLAPKARNKEALQARLGLAGGPEVPVLGLVSRLASQKGLGLLAEVLPHLLQLDVQFAFLGTGEEQYHDLLSGFARQHPSKFGLVLGFDNTLAHQIYAGSDFFLMPSRYEPCGLGQMISLRYGTVPIVRHTGGLADTVTDFTARPQEGNGFAFKEYTGLAFLGAIARGLLTMKVEPAWKRLMRNAMASDFSWERSAKAYVRLYELAMKRHGSC